MIGMSELQSVRNSVRPFPFALSSKDANLSTLRGRMIRPDHVKQGHVAENIRRVDRRTNA